VHALPSLHAAELFAKTHTPSAGLHESSVQPLLSLQIVGNPPTHAPALQVSPNVHASLSLHAAMLFANTQPMPGVHESSVHALPSTHGSVTGVVVMAMLLAMLMSGVFVETLAANGIEVPAHNAACKSSVNCADVFFVKQLVVHVTTPAFCVHAHSAGAVTPTYVVFAGIVVVHVASSAVRGPLFVTEIVYANGSSGIRGPVGAFTAMPRSVVN